MIPKIIHYCWFGKGLMPQSQRDCIKGWEKLMPDYQIIRWDENNFDYSQIISPFTFSIELISSTICITIFPSSLNFPGA